MRGALMKRPAEHIQEPEELSQKHRSHFQRHFQATLEEIPQRTSIKHPFNAVSPLLGFADEEMNLAHATDPLEAVHQYKDVLLPVQDYVQYQDNIIAHLAKHIDQSHRQIIKGNAKDDPEPDQGFTRPKILILTPFRNFAYETILKLIECLPNRFTKEIGNKKRFKTEYGPAESEDQSFSRKPEDYQRLFRGNSDDCFRIGIALRGRAIKLYSEFYSSDIIVASPVGLRMLIGAPEEEKRERDILSSIEILLMDHADVFSMQNFEHVTTIAECLNIIPYEAHDVDFSRIREWCLNGLSKNYRQTIVLTEYLNYDLNAFFNKMCWNWRGRWRFKENYKGLLPKIVPNCRNKFMRFDVDNLAELDEARFKFFTENVLRPFHREDPSRTIIFVPSYFDLVRVRNYLVNKRIDFGLCSEYVELPEVDRYRSHFANGNLQYLLMSERFMFFRRFKMKGAHHVLFYGIPDNAHFFVEILNGLLASSDLTCTTIYCKYDAMALERLVGTERAVRLIKSRKLIHIFR